MKRVFDPSFKYTPSFQTDLHKTFERIRFEQRAATDRDGANSSSKGTVVRLPRDAALRRT